MSEPAPTLAVIGGGQLARMMAQPAIALGLPLRLLAEAEGGSAAQVIPDHLVGDYTDLDTLRKVTEGCPVVTFDHEHVPTEHLHALQDDGIAVRPGPEALVHAQDKGVMRARLAELGVPCPRNARVADVADVEAFARSVGGWPCVLKTTRGGYDGKGVWFVGSAEECAEPFRVATESGVGLLAEELVEFRRELSALVARSPSGQAAAYPVVASTQRDGICVEVVAPAPDLREGLAGEAQEIALRIAGAGEGRARLRVPRRALGHQRRRPGRHAERRSHGVSQSFRWLPASVGRGCGGGWTPGRCALRSASPDRYNADRLAAVRLRPPSHLLPLLFPCSDVDGRHRLVGPPLGRIDHARRDRRLVAQLPPPTAPIVGGRSLR